MGDNYSGIYCFIAYSLGIGVVLGVVYDIFRVMRMLLPRAPKGRTGRILCNTAIFFFDITFFIIAAVISAIFIFHANNGRIRGIALFGSLLGFAAYYNSLGRLTGFLIPRLTGLIYSVIRRTTGAVVLAGGRLWSLLSGIAKGKRKGC